MIFLKTGLNKYIFGIVLICWLSNPNPLFAQRNLLDDLVSETEKFIQQRKWNEALLVAHRLVQLFPTNPEGYQLRANIRESLGDLESACADIGLAIETDPTDSELRFVRGMLAYRTHRFDLARTDFRFLLSSNQSVTNKVFYRQNDFQGTDRIMTIQSGPTDQLLHLLGLVEIKSGNFLKAIEILDSAINMNNREADLFAHRALAYEKTGQDSLASRDYDQAFRINPEHPIALANHSKKALKTGQKDVVERQLTLAIQSNPRSPDLYGERAFYHMEQHQFAFAIQDYDSAIRRNPNDAEWWFNRGLALDYSGRLKEAFESFGHALIIDERHAKSWFMQGALYLKTNEPAKSIESFTIAVGIDQDYSLAYHNRAIAYFKVGQLQSACQDILQSERLGQPVKEPWRKKICN